MTDTFKWEWDTLRGPCKPLIEGEVSLPRGPPQSAPANTGEWFLQLSKDDQGQWELGLRARGLPVDFPKLELEYEITLPKGGKAVEGELEGSGGVGASEKGWTWDVEMTKQEAAGLEGADIYVRVVCGALQKPSEARRAQAAAAHLGALMSSPQPFDVRFTFAKTKETLWASSKVLMEQSPYFNALFANTPLEKANQDYEATKGAENGAADSGKHDQLELKLDPEPSTLPGAELAFYSIAVASPPCTAFKAVLLWIATKQVVFTTIETAEGAEDGDDADGASTSSDSDSSASASAPRPAKRHKARAAGGNLHRLPAISWTAAFRAAYVLKLPALVQLALAEFGKSLTVDNVAQELFGKLSAAYLDVREVALRFAQANWARVKETEGMKEMQKLAKGGKVKKGTEIALELARRLN